MSSPDEAPERPLVYWAISEDALIETIRRAHAGEDPDLLYLELIANSDGGVDVEG